MKNHRPNLKLVWAGRPPVKRAQRDNHLYSAYALLNDAKALTDLLEPLPMPMRAEILAFLQPRKSGRFVGYDKDRRAVITVVTDGNMVGCFIVTDVTVKQAARVAAACDDLKQWNNSVIQKLVVMALGGSIQQVH